MVYMSGTGGFVILCGVGGLWRGGGGGMVGVTYIVEIIQEVRV